MKKYILMLSLLFSTFAVKAQVENSAGDVINYKEIDGKIVIQAMLNGKLGDFVLDISGHNTLMKSELDRLGVKRTEPSGYSYAEFICRDYKPESTLKVESVSVGNVASALNSNFFVIADEPYLKELGVCGTIDASIFAKLVLTIDAERKKITITAPFRPPYMKLSNRTDASFSKGSIFSFDVLLDNKLCNVAVDTWNKSLISLTSEDFAKFSLGKELSQNAFTSVGFGRNIKAEKQFTATTLSVVKSELKDIEVVENSSLKKSTIGYDLLKNGILTLDFSKGKIYYQQHGLMPIDDNLIIPKDVVIEDGRLNPITAKYFKEAIFDYSKGGKFKSKSDKIYVVDFWATWCGPCMQLLPMMEKLAEKYKGQIIFCKVNADKEKELCNAYNIQALPTLFFIPAGGAPIVEIGATIDKFILIIDEMLKIKK